MKYGFDGFIQYYVIDRGMDYSRLYRTRVDFNPVFTYIMGYPLHWAYSHLEWLFPRPYWNAEA